MARYVFLGRIRSRQSLVRWAEWKRAQKTVRGW